jgi:6-phosphogluconolactonase
MEADIQLFVKDNPNDLAREAAGIFSATALENTSEKGLFTVAFSGGATPKLMHSLLAKEPFFSEIQWKKTHIFWVDERCVPENHPSNNFGAAKKNFLDKVPIPESHIYPMPAQTAFEKGADEYQKRIADFFELDPGGLPRFDLIFLGMGADGHTASLFPNQRVLEEKKRLVVLVKGGDPDVYRLTMTLPVLNNAGKVVFLVAGRKKADIVKSVFENDQVSLPATRVFPINGTLIWLMDREAAAALSKSVSYGKE